MNQLKRCKEKFIEKILEYAGEKIKIIEKSENHIKYDDDMWTETDTFYEPWYEIVQPILEEDVLFYPYTMKFEGMDELTIRMEFPLEQDWFVLLATEGEDYFNSTQKKFEVNVMRIIDDGTVTGNFEDYPVNKFQKEKINRIGRELVAHVETLPQLRLRFLTGDLILETNMPLK